MKTLAEIYLEAMEFDDLTIGDPIATKIASHHTCMCGNEIVPYECAWEGVLAENSRTQALTKAVGKCIEALTSIASEHKPSTETEEYWLKGSHEDCAMVLATDTKIARNALAELRAVVEAEGKND